MALIRFLDEVPSVYVDESRDFLLFCRLYDVNINGIKYDIDGVKRIINTEVCKSTLLLLLLTKLGFFSNKDFTDEELRTTLTCFPVLVKHKGSLNAITETIYMLLKILGINTKVKILVINDTPTYALKIAYGRYITDHSIIIGIDTSIYNRDLLTEILKYIVPFGYNIFFYNFKMSDTADNIYYDQYVESAIVSDDINSQLRGSKPPEVLADVNISESTAKVDIDAFTREHSDYWDEQHMIIDDITGSGIIGRQVGAINTIEVIPQGILTKDGQSLSIVVSKENTNKVNKKDLDKLVDKED